MSLFEDSDVASFRSDRLAVVQATYFPKAVFTDAYILQQMQAAEAEVGTLLKVFLEPTQVFPTPTPTDAQITALDGMPWIDEPGYDYDPDFFRGERWGYIITRHRPLIAVQSINLIYPAPTSTVFAIPNDWLRLDRKYGQIRMVPASSQFIAPLGAFLMQALSGGSSIPSMIQATYQAGIQKTDAIFPQVLDVILKRAVQKIMKGAFLPGSGSISVDGMTQSISMKIADFEEDFQFTLFGPKGSNGGLWTAIQGVSSLIAGVAA